MFKTVGGIMEPFILTLAIYAFFTHLRMYLLLRSTLLTNRKLYFVTGNISLFILIVIVMLQWLKFF